MWTDVGSRIIEYYSIDSPPLAAFRGIILLTCGQFIRSFMISTLLKYISKGMESRPCIGCWLYHCHETLGTNTVDRTCMFRHSVKLFTSPHSLIFNLETF